jgi:hypothetical protein
MPALPAERMLAVADSLLDVAVAGRDDTQGQSGFG